MLRDDWSVSFSVCGGVGGCTKVWVGVGAGVQKFVWVRVREFSWMRVTG